MSELISRSMARAEIMDWARVITNPKMLATEDAMHILDSMEGATDEEFKAEAKRRGYKLIKDPRSIKLLSCGCNNPNITGIYEPYSRPLKIQYVCLNCQLEGKAYKSDYEAKKAWNAMIEEKMKEG